VAAESFGERFADLRQRIVSALVLGAAALAAILAGGPWTAGLVAILAALLAWEWRSVTAHAGGPSDVGGFPFIAAPAAGVLVSHFVSQTAGFGTVAALAAVGLAIGLARRETAQAAWGTGGALLIGLATIAFLWLRETDPYGVLACIWVVLVVVASDMGGYFAGRIIGGPKLWPRVSPKKTWAGLAGAVGLASLTGFLFSWATTGTYYGEVVTVSAAASLFAQAGDLGESALKRRFGVKDSSKVLPGHGGVLDRFDGLMAATLVVAAVTLWRGQTAFIWS
jgi:phosphatidate cytidylyltransferase